MIAETPHARLYHRDGRSGFVVVHFGSEREVAGGIDPLARALAALTDLEVYRVVPRQASWYPVGAMGALCTLLAERIEKPAIACGASMGGYGALRHGAGAGCSAVLAFSPQVHIDPTRSGTDGLRYARQFRPGLHRSMDVRAEHLPSRVSVVHDPDIAHDRLHAALLQQLGGVELLRLGHMGHRTDGSVAVPAVARAVLLAAVQGRQSDLSRTLRRGRRHLPGFAARLALACAAAGHPAWAEAIAARACACPSPPASALMARAAARLGHGDMAAALRDLEAVVLAAPQTPGHWGRLVDLYDLLGRPAAADEVLRIAIAETGSFGLCWRLFSRLKGRGDAAAARAVAALAAQHWPRMRPLIGRGLQQMAGARQQQG